MTKTWKMEDAEANLSQLIQEAEKEPQVITRHGKPVAVVNSATGQQSLPPEPPQSALDALRGNFDFSDMPEEDWLERDRSGGLRELDL